jgi:hypothetical protein
MHRIFHLILWETSILISQILHLVKNVVLNLRNVKALETISD